MVGQVVLALLLSAILILILLPFQQQVHQQSLLLVVIAFTNGLDQGALRSNGAIPLPDLRKWPLDAQEGQSQFAGQ